MVSAFINDGQTYSAHIRAVDNLYPEVNFDYRPMTEMELGEHAVAVKYIEGGPLRKAIAAKMADRIVNWNLELPATQENLLRLQPLLFYRVWGIITGAEASDSDPQGKKPDVRDEKN